MLFFDVLDQMMKEYAWLVGLAGGCVVPNLLGTFASVHEVYGRLQLSF